MKYDPGEKLFGTHLPVIDDLARKISDDVHDIIVRQGLIAATLTPMGSLGVCLAGTCSALYTTAACWEALYEASHPEKPESATDEPDRFLALVLGIMAANLPGELRSQVVVALIDAGILSRQMPFVSALVPEARAA